MKHSKRKLYCFISIYYVRGNGDGWQGFPICSVVKNLPASARDTGEVGSVHGSPRSSGEGNGHPLQYFCLKNPMNKGAWRASLHGVTKSWRRLSDLAYTAITIGILLYTVISLMIRIFILAVIISHHERFNNFLDCCSVSEFFRYIYLFPSVGVC